MLHDIASQATGLPAGKKKTHRGRKPSDKPGAKHLSELQRAHGAGDFKTAKIHALNYAKAAHSHAGETPDAIRAEESSALPVASTTTSTKTPDRRAALAKLAMSRSKRA